MLSGRAKGPAATLDSYQINDNVLFSYLLKYLYYQNFDTNTEYYQTTMKNPDFSALKQLDLTKISIAVYEALCVEGSQTAGNLAALIKKPPVSIYRALSQLEQKGFVERNKVKVFHQVTRFRAVRLDKALENLAIHQRRAVQDLIDYQIERSIRQQAGLKTPVSRKDWR